MILLLIPFKISTAQSALMIGPVSVDDELSLQIGYAKEVIGLQVFGFGNFGETVEASGEVAKLFHLYKGLYAGPLAGGGIDWSAEVGTGDDAITPYLFGAGGVGAVYAVTEKFGGWGFWKSRIDEQLKFGFGVYWRI